jgi:hypothetical protein
MMEIQRDRERDREKGKYNKKLYLKMKYVKVLVCFREKE